MTAPTAQWLVTEANRIMRQPGYATDRRAQDQVTALFAAAYPTRDGEHGSTAAVGPGEAPRSPFARG
jgi:hypothetical protein